MSIHIACHRQLAFVISQRRLHPVYALYSLERDHEACRDTYKTLEQLCHHIEG